MAFHRLKSSFKTLNQAYPNIIKNPSNQRFTHVNLTGLSNLRKRRDSNPRAALATYTLSRGASSANLSTFPMAPQVGLEPTTDRLTADSSTTELLWINKMERVMGIEPTTSAWKAEVLPLNYTRNIKLNVFDAVERTWTSTGFLPLGPQPSASAIPPRPLAKRNNLLIIENIIYCKWFVIKSQ